VNILGNSQPGFDQPPQPFSSFRPPLAPLIEVDGTFTPSAVDGLTLLDGSGGSQITYLAVKGFSQSGIVVENSASNTLLGLTIEGNRGNGLVFRGAFGSFNYLQ